MNARFAQMHTSPAAGCGGSFAAPMASLLLIITGIALAVSVVFSAAVIIAVRLCVILAVIVCVIPLLAIISPASIPRER